MKVTVTPTDRIVSIDDGHPCRIWQGTTEKRAQGSLHTFGRWLCPPKNVTTRKWGS